MPSDSETLGFVVLESMASGVPVTIAPLDSDFDCLIGTLTVLSGA